MQQPTTVSFANAVSSICSGRLFGLVECDISVLSHLRATFSEMAPIFKNVEVGCEHLGEFMLCLARQRDYLSRPSHMLVGVLKGERVLLFRELGRWYLQHNHQDLSAATIQAKQAIQVVWRKCVRYQEKERC